MHDVPTFGSLFAGIGGIDLGLERAGWECRWQVEWDAYCQRVLAKHWPDVPRYGDITEVDWSAVEPVDLLAGGFPCQPFSLAGQRRGKSDDRWLWPAFAASVRALRPRHVLVENVPGLLAGHGGMGSVLGDLASLGYDTEWDSVPAAAVGAPHLRYRVWIVAHTAECAGHRCLPQPGEWPVPVGNGRSDGAVPNAGSDEYEGGASAFGWATTEELLPDTDGLGREGERSSGLLVAGSPLGHHADGCGCAVADTDCARLERRGGHRGEVGQGPGERSARAGDPLPDTPSDGRGQGRSGRSDPGRAGQPERALPTLADAYRERLQASGPSRGGGVPAAGSQEYGQPAQERSDRTRPGWWSVEPDVGRVAHGVPARVDRLRALGNAVVPQVVEVIGRALLKEIESRAA